MNPKTSEITFSLMVQMKVERLMDTSNNQIKKGKQNRKFSQKTKKYFAIKQLYLFPQKKIIFNYLVFRIYDWL